MQRQFDKKIKIFHSDGRGEFINTRLVSYFQQQGIIHQLSCLHTPEQTGIVEQRHRTIRELGMTIIFHSGAPTFLWVEAFTTAAFLINHLPSSSINFTSLYFHLYGAHPNYSILRVFGTRCYPYIWDIKKTKFDPKTVSCVFVGYNDKHKGYRCFDPKTNRMFVSRHVIFDENLFPYKIKDSLSPSHIYITDFLDSPLPTALLQLHHLLP